MPRAPKGQKDDKKTLEDTVEEIKEREDAPPAPPEVDAVVVVRTVTDDGQIAWSVGQILGNVTVDQVPTGLRLAAKDVDEKLLG